MTTKQKAAGTKTAASITQPVQEDAAIPRIEPILLDRLDLARKLPIVDGDAKVHPAQLLPGSIEAFRTEDGKTMLVVSVIADDRTHSLAAQEQI